MKEFKGDKRSKAYKEWKKKYDAESKGLGDTIEKITKATGIKKAVELFANGKDCGCDKRKEYLNKILPYTTPECATEQEYIFLKKWYSRTRTQVRPREQRMLIDIYNRVFHQKQDMTNCTPCVNRVINDLRNYFIAYEKSKLD